VSGCAALESVVQDEELVLLELASERPGILVIEKP
jgi:hypothetical protein